jgi:hypothetical protein
MNTETSRHIFDVTEDSSLHLDTQFRASHANIAYCRKASVVTTEAPDGGRAGSLLWKKHEVLS